MSEGLRLGIALPPNNGVGTGNVRTAQRLLRIFSSLGYAVRLLGPDERCDCEVLVALNAVKSAGVIARYREEHPGGKLVVIITGTDLNQRESNEWASSLRAADRIVVLQNKAMEAFSPEEKEKCSVILQSVAVPPDLPARGGHEGFQVCVIGHLRQEKDPLLAAMASRVLDGDSRVQIVQAGAILEEPFTQAVTLEREMNPRYQWVGELSKGEALELIARSDLMVLTSTSEGGPGVIAEAVSVGTPILTTRIDGVVGMLGEDFPGYFEAGDVLALAGLLKRAETDAVFYHQLIESGQALRGRFEPAIERQSWEQLLTELTELTD